MIEIREAGADGWQALRDIRLAALRDDPQAFASTYEREAAFAEADWQRRIARGGSFLAYAPELGPAPAGIAGGFESAPGTVELVSMWVRPQARGRGLGQALVGAVIGWARARGAVRVHLWVAENNDNARLLYERCGFRPTAERQPHPSNAEVAEIGMLRERVAS
ncbi:MAG TPA: GNAT family N-acetyltransferase [Streptosporangiaceae bacterium]|nr:GNAT family N-acetyltransferase [Streptosporangiaceae bacterium]